MPKIGFVGLGTMGLPMAGHLVAKGHDVSVWARNPSSAEPLIAKGARFADSLAELGAQCGIVFLCVNRSEDVRECVEGLTPLAGFASQNQDIDALPPGPLPSFASQNQDIDAPPPGPLPSFASQNQGGGGLIIVDHSTISPQVAREIQAELANRGIGFVDAPITGGSMGAEKGQLTIFCGGEEADIARAQRYMSAYVRKAERVGGPGAGQMMKMVNQIAVGGALLALCESLAFASKAGLDLHQTKELVGGGAAGSWAFENYGPKILAKDWSPGFTIANQRKDFAYVIEAAEALHASVPGTRLVDKLLDKLERAGHSDWTTAALYELMLEAGE